MHTPRPPEGKLLDRDRRGVWPRSSATNGQHDALRGSLDSFKDTGFVKLNIFFPPMLAAAHFTVTSWCKSPISVKAMEQLPVPMEKVPYFVMAVMPLLAVVCAIVALQATAALGPNGYQSQSPREQKAPGKLDLIFDGKHAWIARLRAAQYNTFEAVQCMLCSFFVASSLEHEKQLAVSKLLFAKIATLFLCVRLLYPFTYALDLDFFRTQLWLTGTYAVAMLSFAALFPETILPMLS